LEEMLYLSKVERVVWPDISMASFSGLPRLYQVTHRRSPQVLKDAGGLALGMFVLIPLASHRIPQPRSLAGVFPGPSKVIERLTSSMTKELRLQVLPGCLQQVGCVHRRVSRCRFEPPILDYGATAADASIFPRRRSSQTISPWTSGEAKPGWCKSRRTDRARAACPSLRKECRRCRCHSAGY